MASRILVINDDESILELYRLILEEEASYTVTLSLITFERVTDIEEMQPDLIILDAKLGAYQEGLHLVQKLKRYPPTEAIPVLLCTAADDLIRQNGATLRERGIPILSKPFDIDDLLQQVQELLGAAARKF